MEDPIHLLRRCLDALNRIPNTSLGIGGSSYDVAHRVTMFLKEWEAQKAAEPSLPYLHTHLPEIEWEETDSDADSSRYFLGTVVYQGHCFHAAAYPVEGDFAEMCELIMSHIDGDREPWQTIEIEGVECFMIITPYCD